MWDLIGNINNVFTALSFLLNMIILIKFIPKVFSYWFNKRYIKHVLEFDKDVIQITHSMFRFSTGQGYIYDYITYEALQAINNIINLLNICDYKFNLLGNDGNAKNEIHIGGFVANKRVASYFVQHFPDFKYKANIGREKLYTKFPGNKSIIEYTESETGFNINNSIFLETNSQVDYAFLIKLIKSDFKDNNGKIVHILFGGENIGTTKSTEYFLKNTKQIYKRFKNNHYFFAIEVNKTDGSINYSKGIIDLTDIMFSDNTQ